MWAEAVSLVAKFVQSGVSFPSLKILTVLVHTAVCYCRASPGVSVTVASVLAFTKHLFSLLTDCPLGTFLAL